MSEIHIHNYEAYLLDSMEGRLTGEQQLALDMFMVLHPELSIELEGLADTTFDPEQAFFQDKGALKKTESDLVPAEHFISYVEQQLSAEEKLTLEKSCDANPLLAKELELYKSTIAVADTRIVFEDKETLKRRSKVILFNFRTVSFAAAASVALLILLYAFWPATVNESDSNLYAQTDASQKTKAVLPAETSGSQVIDSSRTLPTKLSVIKHAGQEKLVAYTPEHYHATNTTTLTSASTATAVEVANEKFKEQIPAEHHEPVLLAFSNKTVVDVITEQEDEQPMQQEQKKQGFWALAGKTLKGLNKAGIKSVDGKEESSKENTSYALTLGGMSITHKAH